MSEALQVDQTDTGELQVRLDVQHGTVWLTQAQMVDLFASSKANVSEHIGHIFSSQELDRSASVRKFRTVQEPPRVSRYFAPRVRVRSDGSSGTTKPEDSR
ncbi:hypothetical protein DEFR109230_15050 [Deinococcus frigens]